MMKRLMGLLTFVILLIIGQMAWTDEPLRTVVQSGHTDGILSLSFSPDGQLLALKTSDGITFWQAFDGKLVRKIEFDGGYDSYGLAFSPNGQLIASEAENSNGDYVINLWRVSDGTLIKTFKGGLWRIFGVAFSPDGSILASVSGDLRLWRVFDGSLIRILDPESTHQVSFSSDGRFLASASRGLSGWVKLWRTSDGQLVRTFDGHHGFVFSPDGRFLATATGDQLMLWNLSDGSLVREFKFTGYDIVFSSDGRLLAGVTNDNTIRLWQPADGQFLATFFPFPNSSVTTTPEGFFSGTGDFNKYVHFVKGLEVYDFNQFYDAFYRPDLVEKKLKGEDISKESGGLNIEDAIKYPPPQVVILSPGDDYRTNQRKVTVRVKVTDTGGKIGDIRLYHNGKLVQSSGVYRLAKGEKMPESIRVAYADVGEFYKTARGTILRRVWPGEEKTEIKDFTPLTGTIEKTYEVTLVKGENTISASAFNGENTVMSAMETIKIKADIPSYRPELFVLTIGNDHFKDPSQNLSLHIKDATDFSEKIKKVATPIYGKVHVTILEDAIKPEILHAIHAISANMKPEDVFILFVASHGLAQDDLYYIFTSDFDGVRRRENTISSVEFMELSKKIPALKQIFVLDTCQAGGIKAVVSGLYDARISVLAKALGMHIFAGAKTFQEAQDSYKGSGLFTYFVLRGLEGQADKNQNKEVTVFEMNPYLTHTVKEASQGRQEPFIRNFGEDLPVAKVISR